MFWAIERSKRVKSTKTADGFTKTFPNRVSVSFLGNVLDINRNLILLGKWPRSWLAVRRALFACFALCLVQMPACNLPWERQKSSVPQYFFRSSLCLSVLHKRANASRVWSNPHHVYKPFSIKFWVLGNFFGFWVVLPWRSLWTWNQNSFKFPAFLVLTNSLRSWRYCKRTRNQSFGDGADKRAAKPPGEWGEGFHKFYFPPSSDNFPTMNWQFSVPSKFWFICPWTVVSITRCITR